ncbi:MAG TPA: histidine kinase [Bacillota bacterium]|nr:histidine kinase [Bacillota bacterium]
MKFLQAAALGLGLTLVQTLGIHVLLGRLGNWVGIPVILALVNIAAIYCAVNYLAKRRVLTIKLDEQQLGIDTTFQIANENLSFLRRGLNEETARKTAEIILKISDVAAVAITDRERVLAYVGFGCVRHLQPGNSILTYSTKQVIQTGELKIVENKESFRCPVKDCDCPLEAAIITPLKCQGHVVGCVKLYQTKKGKIPPNVIKVAVGFAQLLAVQMELAELDRQAQLVTNAELQALHAQINPHFLFNTLNTIIMFSRTNPETARRLLIRLAAFFRHSLKKHGRFNTLEEEMEYVNTYLVLEKARFREKLRIIRDIDPEVLDHKVPVLCIQPLVENAIKHGITPKMGQGAVQIIARREEDELLVIVKDDGVGIPDDRLPYVLLPGFGSGNGVGLSNVHERLKGLFGEEHGLRIVTEIDKGTTIYMRIPLMMGTDEGGDNFEIESLNRG